jgi:hypothetical protein
MSEQNGERKVYKTKRKSEPVYIENEQTGNEEEYTLKSIDGTERAEYLAVEKKRLDNQGKRKDFNGLCSDLLARTLYAPNGSLVPAKVIDSWPSDMSMDLYKRAMKLCGFNTEAKDEEAAKN